MPTRIHQLEDTGLLDRLQAPAVALRDGSSESDTYEAQLELQTILEFALCEMMKHTAFTKRFWCDGVEFQRIEPSPDSVHCDGSAWCADSAQWRVPTYATLSFTKPLSTNVASVELGLGDADMSNLAEHKHAKAQRPTTWLEVFQVHRGPPHPHLDPLAVISQLKRLLAESPTARIVGPDWKYISFDSATLFIKHETAGGSPIALDQNWLDGSPVVRLTSEDRR